jgi:hypothetical protein
MVHITLGQTGTSLSLQRSARPGSLPYAHMGRAVIVFALVLGIVGFLPRTAWAQVSRSAPDKLLQAEQSILSSLSARAVSFTDPQVARRSSAPVVRDAPVLNKVAAAQVVKEFPLESPPERKPPSQSLQVVENPPQQQAVVKAAPLESVSQLRTTNALLRSQLEQRDLQVSALTKQVQELQSQLTIAEVEVERLSAVMDAKTRASLGQYKIAPPAAEARAVPRAAQDQNLSAQVSTNTAARDVQPPSPDSNLEVATVAVQKAELRLGPGNNHSALLSLPRGSRLAVEMRQGAWLRVFAPSGERAWIHASLVQFGDSSVKTDGDSAVAVKGFAGPAEDEAFRRFQRGNGGK